MNTLHVLKISTLRGTIEVPVKSDSDFQEFMERALGPYNALRSSQEPELSALQEIHEGMVEDWEVIKWDGLAPDWASMTKVNQA